MSIFSLLQNIVMAIFI